MHSKNKMSPEQSEKLLEILEARFKKNVDRHKGLDWSEIRTKLEKNSDKLWSLSEMEKTGGEPDVIGFDIKSGKYIFYDFSVESPKGRRSICYDQDALESRKSFKPKNSAVNMATDMGIKLLTEEQYRELQTFGSFDLKTSSWIQTPSKIRKLGGAIFADRRYDSIFIYHNGADSYYGSRGFRGSLTV